MNTQVVPFEERIGALTAIDVRSQVNLIQHIMKEVMKSGEHYGVIPGTGKPSLLKAGAEKLCLTFRLDPQYEVTQEKDGMHLTVLSKCVLYHIPSGQRFGSGMGSCSTKESIYAYRQLKRKCPSCGAESINRSKYPPKDEPGEEPGWYCQAKSGGCGRQFLFDHPSICHQKTGRVQNEDLADQYNTVLKMANKRSLVAAVLNATAASDIFTQDIEDIPQFASRVYDESGEQSSPEQPVNSTQQTTKNNPVLDHVKNIDSALEVCPQVIKSKFKAMMVKNGWLKTENIPSDQEESALKFISRETDKFLTEKHSQ